MTKTYQLITDLAAHYYIMLKDGTRETISFESGATSPRFMPGTFTTSDEGIQEYLEDHKMFNKNYRIIREEGTVVYKEKVTISIEDKLKAANEKIKELEGSDLLTAEKEKVEKLTLKVEELEGIIEVQKVVIEEMETAEVIDSKIKQEVKEALPEVKEEAKGPALAEGILNMQQARDYMVKSHNLKPNQMPNSAAVVNQAKKFNVEFPDWKR